MKNFKRFGMILLSIVLVVSTLASCKPKDKDKDDKSGSGADKNVPTLIWYQIGGEPTDLKAGIEEINKYIADKIGAKIDIKYFNWGDYDTKITNMLNTGEYFDMMFVWENFFTGYASQNRFLKLDDKLSSAAPKLKSFINESLWDGVKINGSIAGVPTAKDSAATQYFAFDKAIVDKYNIDINKITSLEALEPVLKQIKAGEEAEKGEKVYPFYLSKEGYVGWKTNYDNYVRYDDASATAKNIYESAELKKVFETIHRWFEEGLINADASTLEAQPKYRICFSGQGFPGAEVNWSNEYGYEVVSVAYTEPVISNTTIHGSINVISANTKYPDQCLKFLELANTDKKLRNMIAYGVEGKNWKDNGDGTITKLDENYGPATYCQASTYTLSPIAPNPANQYELVKEMTNKAKAHPLLGFNFDDKKVATELANVNATVKKYEAELFTGAYSGTTEAYLAKVNSELKSAGIDKVLNEIQSQVDAFLGK